MLNIALATVILLAGWGAAKLLKRKLPIIRQLYLPSSLVAGALLLLLGPFTLERVLPVALIPEGVFDLWAGLPALLISVVFACLFLGKKILGPRETWQLAGPQVVFGQTLAWGQYVLGIALTALVLVPVFNMSPLAGALIEISFEGGHGTAAGMGPVFAELGFADGADLAVGLATIGLVAGIITGVIIINILRRRRPLETAVEGDTPELEAVSELPKNPTAARLQQLPLLSLLLHIGYIVIAIGLGRLLLDGLIALERSTWGLYTDVMVMEFIPLFPLAMIGGVLFQLFLYLVRATNLVDRHMVNRLGTLALDVLIITAIATLSLAVIGEHILPFLLLAVVGIAWNITAFLLLAPLFIPKYWFERGIGDLGQSMGMTATGLLLMKIADPANRSLALQSFGYKQLFFEPIVGGGIFTASSVILISQFGLGNIFVFTLVVMIFWLVFGWWQFGRRRTQLRAG